MHSVNPSYPTEQTMEFAHYYLTEMEELYEEDEVAFGETLVGIHNHFGRSLQGTNHSIAFGTERATFILDDIVIKIPHNCDGVRANYTELFLYQKFLEGDLDSFVPAQCWMHPISEEVRVLVLGMVRVSGSVNLFSKDVPDWCWSIDHAQVGYNKEGTLVAYDYG